MTVPPGKHHEDPETLIRAGELLDGLLNAGADDEAPLKHFVLIVFPADHPAAVSLLSNGIDDARLAKLLAELAGDCLADSLEPETTDG